MSITQFSVSYHGGVCEDGLDTAPSYNFLTDKVSKSGLLLPDVLGYLLVTPRLDPAVQQSLQHINSVRGMRTTIEIITTVTILS